MQLLANKELQELAVKFCQSKIEQDLMGEFQVEIFNTEDEWDPTYLRFIHSTDMYIWRKIDDFVLIIDDEDRPIGFINPVAERGCKPGNLSETDVRAIVKSHPIFADHSMELVNSRSEEKGCLIVHALMTIGDSDGQAYDLRINPLTKEIISATPRSGNRNSHE